MHNRVYTYVEKKYKMYEVFEFRKLVVLSYLLSLSTYLKILQSVLLTAILEDNANFFILNEIRRFLFHFLIVHQILRLPIWHC